MRDEDYKPTINGMRWGEWQLNTKDLTLEFRGSYWYLPLDEICNGGQMMDWIRHVLEKSWGTPQVMYDLLCALECIFQPRETFGNSNKAINAKWFLLEKFAGRNPYLGESKNDQTVQ